METMDENELLELKLLSLNLFYSVHRSVEMYSFLA